MTQIFEQAKDLHVVATMVYNNGDEYAYTDAECKKPFKVSELKEAFIKGALIEISGVLYHPVSFDGAAISYLNNGSAATLKADADEVNE